MQTCGGRVQFLSRGHGGEWCQLQLNRVGMVLMAWTTTWTSALPLGERYPWVVFEIWSLNNANSTVFHFTDGADGNTLPAGRRLPNKGTGSFFATKETA